MFSRTFEQLLAQRVPSNPSLPSESGMLEARHSTADVHRIAAMMSGGGVWFWDSFAKRTSPGQNSQWRSADRSVKDSTSAGVVL